MTSEVQDLIDMPTQWTVIFDGQHEGDAAEAARRRLLVRYHEAILRFLRRELHDDLAAGELYSNFAMRVLEFDPFLRRADRDRGRFRDYLRAVLRRMVIDYFRRQQRQKKKEVPLGCDSEKDPADERAALANEDDNFLECWRQELINQAWQALEKADERTGQPYATLLRLKERQPELRAAQLAEELAGRLDRPFTAVGVRKLLQRGRELFGDLLVQEVARSLQGESAEKVAAERVEQELIDLGLLFSYCKEALRQY
jgi:RNA polymerase sigma-70 factor (ECF subfamily)